MTAPALAFELSPANEAGEPPEARGLQRDEVRLLVSHGDQLDHARFRDLPGCLGPGDLLVVNASATLPAALPATRPSGEDVVLHLSTPLPGTPPPSPREGSGPRSPREGSGPRSPREESGPRSPREGSGPRSARGRSGQRVATPPPGQRPSSLRAGEVAPRWVVELRRDGGRVRDARAGEVLALPAGGHARLLAPYLSPGRLWVASLAPPVPLSAYLAEHGRPIAYRHARGLRPLGDFQTIFATEPGSAEMPSAGRPFSHRLLERLRAHGVEIASIILHTGVSSLERGEAPYPERYRVPPHTATAVNAANRVIAVGTTVVRALETVAARDGTVSPAEGWTRLVITPERGVRAIDALITGWHEPEASHLLMLEAIAGREAVARAYAHALAHGYLWHEFGDSHLLLRD